jgi:hypothetical protein
MRITVLIFVLIINSVFSFSQQIDWSADLEYLRKELPKKHKDLFFKLSQSDFNDEINKLKNQSVKLSDVNIAIKLQQLIAKVGDSHTGVSYDGLEKDNNTVPFRTYLFDEGLYILWANEKYEALLGQRLIAINGYKVDQLFDSLRTLVVNDNEAIVKEYIPKRLLTKRHVLKHFKFLTDSVDVIEHEDSEGIIRRTRFTSADRLVNVKQFNAENLPIGWSNPQAYFWEKYIPESKTYFIQYNQCWSRELEYKYGNKERAEKFPSFGEFQTRILDVLKSHENIKVIFDLRYNGGGNSRQGEDLIGNLKNLPAAEEGKLFVLIGRNTFSSAIINALQFKEIASATLLGEETAGKTQSYGEVKQLTLPNSKLTVNYSTKFFKLTKTYLSTVTPDLNIPVTFSDYKNGIDRAVQYVIDQ